MADTTVFSSNNQAQGQQKQTTVSQSPPVQPAPSQPPPVQPVTPPATFQSPLYEQPLYDEPPAPPAAPPPVNDAPKPLPRFHFGTILKVVIGFVIFLAVISGIFLFISSHSGSNKKVTVTYWGLWEDKNVMQPVIDDFEKQYPNIVINYSQQDIHQYKDRVQTRIHDNTSDAPDIFRFHNSWTASLQNELAPLPSSVITAQELQKNFYPVVTNDVTINGVAYGIPLEIDTLALFINTDMFQAAGLTPPTDFLQEFGDDAAHLTRKDSITGEVTQAGAAIGSYDSITHAPDILALLFAQQGVDPRNMSKNSDGVAAVLSWYTQFSQGEDAVWSDKLGNSLNAFAGGKVAMYFGYSWDIPQILALNKNLHFKVVPVPQLPGRNITEASYWVEGVSAKSLHKNEAMQFLHYLAQKETEQKLFTLEAKERQFGEPYARTDLAETLKSNQNVYPFVQQGKNATSSLFAADTFDEGLNGQANEQLQKAVNTLLNGKNGASPDSTAKTLDDGIDQIINQFGY